MADLELISDGAVATLRFNRPERKNATTPELWRLLDEHLAKLEHDAAIRAVILTGAGDAFCAGADVGGGFPATMAEARARLGLAQASITRLHTFPKPVVAAVRGPAVGSGLSLALACDFVIASETARFCHAFTRIGLVGDAGALYLLSQRVGLMRAKDLIYTGRFMDAAEALQAGICLRVVPDAQLTPQAAQFARELGAGPTFAIGASKRLLLKVWTSLHEFLPQEAHAVPLAWTTADAKEGIAAIREKRPARFTGE